MNKGIDVEIIKDSINWTGKRLTTFVLKYPRYIHSELMTHRVFSKNSASSRAIPINRMIQNILDDMVHPIWTLNQSGMQGIVLTDKIKKAWLNSSWKASLQRTIDEGVKDLISEGIHKQNVNRLLEPWMHIKIILTGTDFDNFFELRNHKDAQPEIQLLARKMKYAMEESKPQWLNPGEWHIPFGDINEALIGEYENPADATLKQKLASSVARCARISYNNVDGTKSDILDDYRLFEKLLVSEPLHASPAEHQAKVPTIDDYAQGYMSISHSVLIDIENINNSKLATYRGKYFSNLQGWIQYRKILEEQKQNNK